MELGDVEWNNPVPQRSVSQVFFHLGKLGEIKPNQNKTKLNEMKWNTQGHESQRGTTRELEKEGKRGKEEGK
jgi:hypothetical protein